MQLWEICKEIYRELFKQSTPKASFTYMLETGEAKQKDFFMKYYLNDNNQQNIIDNICNEHNLTKWQIRKINEEIHLGCSPNSSIESWRELINNEKSTNEYA